MSPSGSSNFLVGDGEMARLVRSTDWSRTPLGPIEHWPQSLLTTVSLCLASNFPINIIWGRESSQIYNDGYRVVCGEVHPRALGEDYRITWASAWPAIGGPFEAAWAGRTSYLENQRMFLTRNGYLEETFFTFSLSPIRDESGGVGGVFHPVTETTGSMLAERRTRALRDLTGGLATAGTFAEIAERTVATLRAFDFDLPFLLFYAEAPQGGYALAASFGADGRCPACPPAIAADAMGPWPFADAIAGRRVMEVEGVGERFAETRCGPYEEPPERAFLLPLSIPGEDQPAAVVVAGVSPRLPLDDGYRGFYDLIAAAIGAALTSARNREEERRRAEALAVIDRAKTAFFSNVSHEFRTPLTLMLGPLEDALSEREELPAKARERLDVAYRNALRLLKLVNSLLDFSRLEAGRLQANFEPTDLAAVTADLASNFRSACERAGLELAVDCRPLAEPIYVDRAMWETIVLNLISNAFKFTLEGRIEVALRPTADGAELVVRDSGVGIPLAEQDRIFDRFHRVEGQTGRTHEGTGIGLSMVRELVALHGGGITVDSAPGAGTAFVIDLRSGFGHLQPHQVQSAAAPTPASSRAQAYVLEATHWLPEDDDVAIPVAASAEQPRVVLADDNTDMRRYVRQILQDAGYAVEAVADGDAALAAARGTPRPDLILSDVMMPGLDGFQLVEALRADPAVADLPIILLSARAGEAARLEGLSSGADDYLMKPFSARELRARVDGAISLARQRRDFAARERDLHTLVATERTRSRLRQTEEDMAFALTAGRLGSWDTDLVTGDTVASEICRATFGLAPDEPYGRELMVSRVHPEDRDRRDREIAAAVDGHGDLDLEYRILRPDGSLSWVLMRGRAGYDDGGRPTRLTGISLDITERKLTEQRQRLLLDELNHRVKNTLATVQSIAMQTRRTAPTPEAFNEALDSRIEALANAHDLLTRTSWEGVSLTDLLRLTLRPYSKRVTIEGPPVKLGPNAAVTLNMAFNELATNAAKYGALSAPHGRVSVRWQVDRGAAPPEIVVEWTEAGGPPVSAPADRGFGSRLLEQGVPRELGGSVGLDFQPEGLNGRMRFPTSSKIQAPDA